MQEKQQLYSEDIYKEHELIAPQPINFINIQQLLEYAEYDVIQQETQPPSLHDSLREKIRQLVQENDGFICKYSYKDKSGNSRTFSLRPFEPKDINIVRKIYKHPYTNIMVAPVTEQSEEGYETKLGKFIECYQTDGISCYVLGIEGEPVGLAGLTYLDDAKTKVEVNAALFAEHQNKYLSNIIKEILGHLAFDKLELESLYGKSLSDNLISQATSRQKAHEELRQDKAQPRTVRFKGTRETASGSIGF